MELLTSLMPHQQTGVDKLLPLRIGALYMEMGTGKTRTALEIVKRRLDAGKLHRVLWLCPCSVKVNLERDLNKHANGWQDVIRIDGIESLSSSSRLAAELFNIVVNEPMGMLIVDESNLVKNHKAIRSNRITILAEHCKYRMILNGTPVTRNESDLFSQWYLLDWRILGYRSFYSFAANHLEYDKHFRGRVRRVLNVDYLTDKIAPYSYQISKRECLSLPAKKYSTLYFNLEAEQSEHYHLKCEEFLSSFAMDGGEDDTAIYRTFTMLQEVSSGRCITSPVERPLEHCPFFKNPKDNPRMDCLLRAIKYYIGDEKLVIWCKFQHEIDDITDVLTKEYGSEKVVQFCGTLNVKQRNASIAAFQTDAQFFVANKTCAGYGLNLQFCHNAIYYNNDWNWGTRAQSEDRLHRIAQENDVSIIDICAASTIDERILRCLERKENLADSFRLAIKENTAAAWLEGTQEVKA